MAAERSLTDLIVESTAARITFQQELAAVASNDVSVITTGFTSIAKMLTGVEDMMKAASKRIEKSEEAILTSISRDAKKFQGDAGNHKAIQALKVLDADREKFVEWNDKFLNAISRIHPHSRKILKACNKQWMTLHDDRLKME